MILVPPLLFFSKSHLYVLLTANNPVLVTLGDLVGNWSRKNLILVSLFHD
jgi:hypothetical protein